VGVFNYKDIYCEMKDLIRHILIEEIKVKNFIQEAKQKKIVCGDINDESFARIFHTLIQEYNNSNGKTQIQIKWAMQQAISCWSSKPFQMISKKIAEHFIKNHPNVNPFDIKWKGRKKYGVVDGNKSLIVFEHTTPIMSFFRELVKLNSVEEILPKLREYSGICLITRDEDNCLYSKKLGSIRSDGWRVAYSSCGIEPLTKSEYESYKQQKLNSTEDERFN
jgi:hypothetical protein